MSGGGSSTSMVQSPEQKELYNLIKPIIERTIGYAGSQGGTPLPSSYGYSTMGAQPTTSYNTPIDRVISYPSTLGGARAPSPYSGAMTDLTSMLNAAATGQGVESWMTLSPNFQSGPDANRLGSVLDLVSGSGYYHALTPEQQRVLQPLRTQLLGEGSRSQFYPAWDSMTEYLNPSSHKSLRQDTLLGNFPAGSGSIANAGFGDFAQSTQNSGLWDIPQGPSYPQMPSLQNILSGIQPYSIPSYNVGSYNVGDYALPDATALTPNQDWWNTMATPVVEGLKEPIYEAERYLTEKFGGAGQAGSARGGYSGNIAAATGQLWGQAMPQVSTQAWNLSAPGYFKEYDTTLGQARDIWGAELTRDRDVWSGELAKNAWQAQAKLDQNKWLSGLSVTGATTDYQNELNRLLGDYSTGQDMWKQEIAMNQYPFSTLTGMFPGTFPTPVTTQKSDPLSSLFGAGSMLATLFL